MSTPGTVHFEINAAGVASIVFDRPAAHNAMTWPMYEGLMAACESIANDPRVRVATLRGAGGKAFVAGTDISQFQAFKGGDDGVEYERMIEAGISALEQLPVPTLALVDGWAFGGGLVITAACDLRIGTPAARFGVPIARTLGNCLSVANVARLVAAFGASRTQRMLLLADAIDADEARACGFLTEIVAPEALAARADVLCERLCGHAPITMRVSKEAVRRLASANLPDGEDLVRACYGSEDFRTGIEAFIAKTPARWSGR
ncbi:MAG: enoyl-CoA hydratase/isomerase family protein [Janthinobacterium lividum]